MSLRTSKILCYSWQRIFWECIVLHISSKYASTLDNLFQWNHNRNIKNKQYIVAEEKLTFILRAFKISFVSSENISFVISWDTKTNLCKYNNIRTKETHNSFKKFEGIDICPTCKKS